MNKHIGSSFDDFLKEEDIYEEVSASAIKRVLAWQMENYMTEHHLKKVEFAKMLETSRSQLDRLLDPENTSLNIKTLSKAAKIMKKRLNISFA